MNAAASVLGSVLAMVIAIQFGLTVTLACGVAAYLLALVLLPTLRAATRLRAGSAFFVMMQRRDSRGVGLFHAPPGMAQIAV